MAFAQGQSGNVGGRPRGIVDRRAKLRKAIEGHLPGIIDVMVQAALAGDVGAARLLIDKTMPNMKPTDASVKVALTGTLSEQASKVLSEVAAGKISPSEAESIMRTIGAAARIAEIDDLARRVEALEEQR